MEIFFFWLILSIAIGIGAASRGRSGFGWFLLSIVISPLIALILLALMPNKAVQTDKPNPDTHVKCPDCAELVLAEARVCKHCGCRLVPASEQAARKQAAATNVFKDRAG